QRQSPAADYPAALIKMQRQHLAHVPLLQQAARYEIQQCLESGRARLRQDGHGPGRADVGPPQGSDRLHLNGSRQAEAAVLAKARSEEHTSELQSHLNLVCRLLLVQTTASAALGRDPHQARVVNPSGPAEL